MKRRFSRINAIVIALITLTLSAPTAVAKDEWQRVITGADFIIDVSTASLLLQPNRTISARFRTTLSKSEEIAANAGGKYRVRLETIQFRWNDRQYRISETILLDTSGKAVFSSPPNDKIAWMDMKGPTTGRLFNAASELPPFGAWKVLSYRFAEGGPPETEDSPDLKNLIGSEFYLHFDRFQAGKATCSTPEYEMRAITDKDFNALTGHPLKSVTVQTDKIEALILKCGSETSFPPQSFCLRLAGGRMLMLWEGVFVELEKTK